MKSAMQSQLWWMADTPCPTEAVQLVTPTAEKHTRQLLASDFKLCWDFISLLHWQNM